MPSSKSIGLGMLTYRHICLDKSVECDDTILLKGPRVYDVIDELLLEFSNFFERTTGYPPWAMQRSWARRMLAGESFALIAPTGVGKSTLLQVYGLYRASSGETVLYVVPTRSLVEQVVGRVAKLGSRMGVKVRSDLSPLTAGIHVVTHMLLFRKREALESASISTVIVDDFDAILKNSSLLDSILFALGFVAEDVNTARNLIKLKQSAYALKHANTDRYKEVVKSIEKLEASLLNSINSRRVGQLLIASATGRGRKERIKVLRELLGFEIGSIVDYLRNVREFSAQIDTIDVVKLVKILGRGTLVFVSKDLGRNYVKRLVEELEKDGVRASIAHTSKAIERLRKGDVDVLIGVATYYGVLTRGIDEPTIIKSSVFIGTPKFTVPLDMYLSKTSNVIVSFRALASLYNSFIHDYVQLTKTYEALSRLRPSVLKVIDLCLMGLLQPSSPRIEELIARALEMREYVLKAIKRGVSSVGWLNLGNALARPLENGGIVVEIPDIYTYIQASGRTSRLLNGRMTLGVSVLLYENRHIYEIFLKRLKALFESNFRDLDHAELLEALHEATRSRLTSSSSSSVVSRIIPTLLIVESPTKARTIAKMFGGGGKRYVSGLVAYEAVIPVGQTYFVTTIVPSLGHLFDLAVDVGIYGVRISKDGSVDPVYTSLKRCRDCGHQFTDEVDRCPRCSSLRIYDSMRTVNVMRKLAKESSLVVIATDADEEGEKIAYDIYVALKPYNENIKRAEFHEITRYGIISGMSSLRDIDVRLVKSQVFRRVDDRLVGFGLSSVIKEYLGSPNAGGGRVQTPVLSWVVKRYEEHRRNKAFVLYVELPFEGVTLKLFVDSDKEAERLSAELSNGIELVPIAEEVETLHPKPPYTTDTALEELSKHLRVPPGEVMKILQELYEDGFITYHRTSSTRVSNHGIEIARSYLASIDLQHLLHPRSWGSEGAHEAIRPTRPVEDIETESIQLGIPLTRKHYEAYRTIFKRFIASQMSSSKILYRYYSFRSSGKELAVVKLPVKVIEEGFTRVLPIKLAELPNEVLILKPKSVRSYRGSKVGLMTSAEAIRKMREEGIGRPSTYAKAIENNRRHGYVVISKYKQNLIPTKRGTAVLRLVERVCPQLISPLYTARLMRLAEMVDNAIPYDLAILLPLSVLAEIEISNAISKNLSENLVDVNEVSQ
ncbi:MAG: reverse gyrase [Sulfolobales archaeon]